MTATITDIKNFHFHIHRGPLETISAIIKLFPSIINKTHDGLSPLHRAVYTDNLEVTELLITLGADINQTTLVNNLTKSITPSDIAILRQNMMLF